MKKIIILDNSTLEVHIYMYDENVWESPEDFINDKYSNDGITFKDSQCSWMLTQDEGELSITIH